MENGKRITQEDQAKELVAELGAAMVCKQTGLEAETREDHIQYLASWRKVIKKTIKTFFRGSLPCSTKSRTIIDPHKIECS